MESSDRTPVDWDAFHDGNSDTVEDRKDVGKPVEKPNRSLSEILESMGRISTEGDEDDELNAQEAGAAADEPRWSLLGTDPEELDEDAHPDLASRFESVAEGGMGVVHSAFDVKLGRLVAIKVLKARYANAPPFVRRFLTEARLTSRLDHPNIIPIHDLYEMAVRPYYSMPMLGGTTLAEAIHRHHAGKPCEIDLRSLLGAYLGVCNAIAHAHERGMIHRDIKASNVQIDRLGQAIVLDWGLAKEVESEEDPLAFGAGSPVFDTIADMETHSMRSYQPTMPGSVIGTLRCIPPEQARGERERIGKQSDVFGLGALLYTILTGRLPYDAKNRGEVLAQARAAEFLPPSEVQPTTPKALEAIALKAMRAEPEDRYESAEAVGDEIRRWLADEPVEAFPDSRSDGVGRWARKHQSVVAGIGMFLIAAVVALGVGITLVKQEQNRTEAEKNIANSERIAAANEATAARALALDLRGIVGELLPMTPGTEITRTRVADALVRYVNGSMIRQKNDRNAQAQREMVQTLREAAASRAAIGHHAAALKDLKFAERLVRDMIAVEPDWPLLRAELADILLEQGQFQDAMNQISTAHESFINAEAEAIRLVELQPNEATFLRLRAFARADRSAAARNLGRLDEAINIGRAALADFDQLVARMSEKSPPLTGAQPWLVLLRRESTRRGLGVTLFEAKQFAEADRLIAESVEEIKRLGGNRPDTHHATELAASYLARGRVLAHAPTTRRESLGQFDLAIKESAALARDFPGVTNHRSTLARAKASRAAAISDLLNDSPTPEVEALRVQAELDAEEAVSIFESLTQGSHPFNDSLARALVVLGNLKNDPKILERAILLEQERKKRQPADPGIAPTTEKPDLRESNEF